MPGRFDQLRIELECASEVMLGLLELALRDEHMAQIQMDVRIIRVCLEHKAELGCRRGMLLGWSLPRRSSS